MNKTKIEWVKNPDGTQGYTWNPITGCLNGCPYCYARKLANGRLKPLYLANRNIAPLNEQYLIGFNTEYKPELDPFYPRFWSSRIDGTRLELISCKPRGIFPCDMGELFGAWLPSEWQEEIFDLFREFPQHRFYLLTKQHQNLIKFSPFPDNCEVGVTVTNSKAYQDAIVWLNRIEATVRFISFEPLLGRISVDSGRKHPRWLGLQGIDGVIIGAQTRPYKPPELEWVCEIVRACDKASIPVFLKDNLAPVIPFTTMFRTEDRKLRQEMPCV